MTPIRLGITGGIGSGKSVVAHVLQALGIPVFDCDAESKRLTVVHPHIRQQLVALLGAKVYQGNALNKPYLANYLFSSPEHVQQINSIIHPVLKDYFLQWVSEQSTKFVAIESAILFEAGYDDVVDYVVMISAPLEVRIARSIRRDGVTRSAIEERIRQQMDDEEKRRRSQFDVVNDGVVPVIPQVLEIINTLSQK
ncbi:MAG: dephospho-CoA kinase [Bacteroidaceae bacterium]|nr:dephospho-CoA kinase [Bacteroidaceae bacterium]